jgi:sec-independent protein translocase protein TatA
MGDLFTPAHILLIILVALLLFGPKKLPELGRSFGRTLKEFKEGMRGAINDDPPEKPADSSDVKPLQAAVENSDRR